MSKNRTIPNLVNILRQNGPKFLQPLFANLTRGAQHLPNCQNSIPHATHTVARSSNHARQNPRSNNRPTQPVATRSHVNQFTNKILIDQ